MENVEITNRLAKIYFEAMAVDEKYSAQEIDKLFRVLSGGIGIDTCFPNGKVN